MFKLLLRHLIYEECINVFFNAVNANFKDANSLERVIREAENVIVEAMSLRIDPNDESLGSLYKYINQLDAVINQLKITGGGSWMIPDVYFFIRKLKNEISLVKERRRIKGV